MASTHPVDLSFRPEYRNFIDVLFMREALSESLLVVRGANWTSAAQAIDCDFEVLASVRYDFSGSDEILIRRGDALAHVIQRERAVTVRVAARSDAEAHEVEQTLRTELPSATANGAAGEVEARFWWSEPQGGTMQVARTLEAPAWPGIRLNYTAAARAGLDELMTSRPARSSGRLLLFHGPPGTGKTHAALSLASGWQSWLDTEIISDPEKLFGSPKYLLDVVTRGREARSKRDRWQMLLLEDSGEFLTPYAKSENGQALSRLLNLTDGALGRATRTLVLVTTNERVDHLHEAVARPGRCLAEVAFAALSEQEVAEWCSGRQVAVPRATSMTLAELYDLQSTGRVLAGPERRFGFAA